jgi:hypothetical protein
MLWYFNREIPINSMSFIPNTSDLTLFSLASYTHKCASLTCLDLSHCRKVTDVAMIALAQQCQLLTDLSLSYTYLRNETFITFARSCSSITSLDVSNCQLITDEAMQYLAQNCLLLTALNVSQCPNISYLSLQALALHSAVLATLNLCYCRTCDEGVTAIANGFPALTSLDLSYSLTTTTNAALIALAQRGHHLTALNLSNCSAITDDVVSALSVHSQLRLLDLTDCFHVTDSAVVSLSEHCPSLTTLDLTHCDITDDAVVALAETCRDLSSLSLSYTDITDVSVVFLAHNCSSLTSLNLSCCDITDTAILALSQACTAAVLDLHTLDISSCESITSEAVMSCFFQEQSLTAISFSGVHHPNNVYW